MALGQPGEKLGGLILVEFTGITSATSDLDTINYHFIAPCAMVGVAAYAKSATQTATPPISFQKGVAASATANKLFNDITVSAAETACASSGTTGVKVAAGDIISMRVNGTMTVPKATLLFKRLDVTMG